MDIDEMTVFREAIQKKGYEKHGDYQRASLAEDDLFIYNKVVEIKPKIIVEIGTWYGLSACVMAKALVDCGMRDSVIYTCDKNNMYIPENPFATMIKFYNMQSKEFLKSLKRDGVKTDLMFIDGRLNEKDANRMYNIFNGLRTYMLHDYFIDKGKFNFEEITKTLWHHNFSVEVPSVIDKYGVFIIKENA